MKFAPLCLSRALLNNCSIFSIAFSPFSALQFPILIIFYAIFHFTTFTLFMQISAKCYLNLAKRITVTRLSTPKHKQKAKPKPWFRASSLLSVSCENRYDYDSRCRSGRHVEQMKKLITHQVAQGEGGMTVGREQQKEEEGNPPHCALSRSLSLYLGLGTCRLQATQQLLPVVVMMLLPCFLLLLLLLSLLLQSVNCFNTF